MEINYEDQVAGLPSTELCLGLPYYALQDEVVPNLVITPMVVTSEVSARVVDLANRMSRRFWHSVNVYQRMTLSHFPDLSNNGVRVAIRPNEVPCVPSAFIVCASASIIMNVSQETLVDFINNEETRQWNGSCDKRSTKVIPNIYLGADLGMVSFFEVSKDDQSNMFIFQQSTKDADGNSIIVFDSVSPEQARSVITGTNVPFIPLLPGGFLISRVDNPGESAAGSSANSSSGMPGRSLLMLFLQRFARSDSDSTVSKEDVDEIKTTLRSIMETIKTTFSD